MHIEIAKSFQDMYFFFGNMCIKIKRISIFLQDK